MIQQLNNLIFGEQKRRREKREGAVTTVLYQPDPRRVWGIDIAGRWDGLVDFKVTAAQGGAFTFIKGLDGSLPASLFAENRAAAIGAGMAQAPYGWLYRNANVACSLQAQAMVDLLRKYPADLPPVVDFEWTRWLGVLSNPTWKDLELYVDELIARGGHPPLVYTAYGYADQFGPMPATLRQKIAGIFIANYKVAAPTMPQGFLSNAWIFWQASEEGDATKVAPNSVGTQEVDIDYFNGDREKFILYSGGVTPPPAPGGTMYYKGIVKSTATPWVNVRTAPNSTATDIGNVYPGDKIAAVEIVDGWWHVDTINDQHVAVDSWIHGQFIDLLETLPNIPGPTPNKTHIIEVYSDGKVVIDGAAYP